MTDLIGADLGLTEALSKNALVPTTDQPQKGKDFTSDQEVRWCPGCGDYVILNTIRNFLPELGLRRENVVAVLTGPVDKPADDRADLFGGGGKGGAAKRGGCVGVGDHHLAGGDGFGQDATEAFTPDGGGEIDHEIEHREILVQIKPAERVERPVRPVQSGSEIAVGPEDDIGLGMGGKAQVHDRQRREFLGPRA